MEAGTARQTALAGRYPDRTAAEFVNGDRYFEMDTQLQYPKLFPNDVNFFIGKSDPAKDWYFEQVPHNEDPAARVSPFRGVIGNGRATPMRFILISPTHRMEWPR